jgi:coenzyme Q-binding protein COQ10
MHLFKSLLGSVTKKHVEHRIIRTHPLHLFHIVQDIDSYHKFLPLCTHSKVLRVLQGVDDNRSTPFASSPQRRPLLPLKEDSKISDLPRRTLLEATLTVGIPPMFVETYVSRVSIDRSSLSVEAVSIQSQLFDSLRSKWSLSGVANNQPVPWSTMLVQHQPLALENVDQCHVSFEVELSVSDPVIVGMLDALLKEVASRQVHAFSERCQDLPANPSTWT